MEVNAFDLEHIDGDRVDNDQNTVNIDIVETTDRDKEDGIQVVSNHEAKLYQMEVS